MAIDPDYRWSMVAGPSHKYFWILARTPELPDYVMRDMLQTARNAGFELNGLIRVSHGSTPTAGK
jgi:apolipoprotein D and lipocalin family protein